MIGPPVIRLRSRCDASLRPVSATYRKARHDAGTPLEGCRQEERGGWVAFESDQVERDKRIAELSLNRKSYADRHCCVTRGAEKPMRLSDDGRSGQEVPSDKDINGLEFLGMARPPLAEGMRK
jgi:hypothetical protein